MSIICYCINFADNQSYICCSTNEYRWIKPVLLCGSKLFSALITADWNTTTWKLKLLKFSLVITWFRALLIKLVNYWCTIEHSDLQNAVLNEKLHLVESLWATACIWPNTIPCRLPTAKLAGISHRGCFIRHNACYISNSTRFICSCARPMCCVNICAGLFRSGWLLFSKKRKTVRYRLQGMGHVRTTTTAPRVKGPTANPKIGHLWMKFTSALSRNGQTVTLPRHRAPERQSRRQASLHDSISQVKAPLAN